jgi:hypothetical protein
VKITITGNNKAANVQEVELSKTKNAWTFHVYTEDLDPFGTLSIQGKYCFYLTFRKTRTSFVHTEEIWTQIKFTPENDEEQRLLFQDIVASPSKVYHPKRKKGQYCQKVFIIKQNKEDIVSLPLIYEP